jgi:hypothetical protein
VVAHHTTDKILILRSSRGTFDTTNQIRVDASNYAAGTHVCTPLAPTKQCPFGTFAGGVFFAAPGVLITDYAGADVNNFELIDDEGNVVSVPSQISLEVSNTRAGDSIAIFRLDGDDIEKDDYAAVASQAIGSTTLQVGSSIVTETPGQSTGGVLRIVDDSASLEYRLRYSSWASDTFTLASSSTDAMESGTDTNTVHCDSAFTNSKVGDLIYNSTRTAVTYITSITSNDEVEVSPTVTSQTTGDNFTINTLPILTTANDDVYVPFMDVYETTGTAGSPGSESVNITYPGSTIDVRVRVRQAGDIFPFEIDGTITDSNFAVTTIRTADTIYS